jgi:hypothetical protein
MKYVMFLVDTPPIIKDQKTKMIKKNKSDYMFSQVVYQIPCSYNKAYIIKLADLSKHVSRSI